MTHQYGSKYYFFSSQTNTNFTRTCGTFRTAISPASRINYACTTSNVRGSLFTSSSALQLCPCLMDKEHSTTYQDYTSGDSL